MPLTIYKRGDVYHYRGTVAGKRQRGTTGFKRKDDANRFIIDLQSTLQKESDAIKAGGKQKLTFARAAILYRQAGKSTRFIDDMEKYWEGKFVADIKPGIIRQAAIELYPRATASTRNRHVIVPTQAIINHAASLDMCHPIRVSRFKIETKVKTPATWEWVQAFMANSSPHLGALCCFMFLTGARVSEAAEVRWRDVNIFTRKALIRETKVGKERNAHLPPELIEALGKIESNREPDAKTFKYSSRHTIKPQWNKVIKRAKIEYLTFHSCRHGFATTLLHKGIDPITVAKLGGWADAQLVFKTYGHAMQDETLTNLLTDTKSDTQDRHNSENVIEIKRLSGNGGDG